ncbi:MAG: helix-turn-helix transcriptional regulator [Mycobacteriales bacterium]
MEHTSFDQQVSRVAALDKELTRTVYRLVLDRPWVTRDETSEALGVARSVAAFHLDKLVDAGLATVRFERVSGKTGPGAGRPAKLYGRSGTEVEISLPPRRYALAGSVLADAVVSADRDGSPIVDSVATAARAAGQELGRASAVPSKATPSLRAALPGLCTVLAENGYEPQVVGSQIALYNCPFHALAERHRGLVCDLNAQLLAGVVEGAGLESSVSAVLAPEPGMCCVRIQGKNNAARKRRARRSRPADDPADLDPAIS